MIRVGRSLAVAALLIVLSACKLATPDAPGPHQGNNFDGKDAVRTSGGKSPQGSARYQQDVYFNAPGPHQIDVYAVAPDMTLHGNPADPARKRRWHLKIYLEKDPDDPHKYIVRHERAEDQEVP